MNPLLRDFLGSVLRHALGPVFVWLVAQGILTSEQTGLMLTALIAFLITLGWSLWQKYGARQKIVTALAMPAGSTEKAVEAIVKEGGTPPVTTPKTVAPQLAGVGTFASGID